eukprot:jgi/Picsp_1/2875/NSC_01100-R1_protein
MYMSLSTAAAVPRRTWTRIADNKKNHHRPDIVYSEYSQGMQGKKGRDTVLVLRATQDDDTSEGQGEEALPMPPVGRDDDVLPDSLTDAIQESAAATADAMASGFSKCVVEILLPDFWDPMSGPVYSEEGDQQRFWKLTRRFIDDVVSRNGGVKVRAIYPDAGVAAMLRNQWSDAEFSISSLNDRKPVEEDDELIVMAAPDPPSLNSIMKISNGLGAQQSLVMFNPRLASGDVGVGLNMRRLRDNFLKDFMTVYSLRPIGDIGSVFKRFPSQWQVFVADPETPGRYVLAAEQPSRPGGEDLDYIVMKALGDGEAREDESSELGIVDQVSMVVRNLQRFMNSLSR